MRALPTLVVVGALAIASSTASAAVCLVDVGGGLGIPGAYASTNAALAVCNTPGSVIEIRCPAGGCTDNNIAIAFLNDITIRSSELDGLGGPVVLAGINNQPALTISNGSFVTVSGISGFNAQQIAVWISNSEVIVTPNPEILPRYTTFSAANIGLLVDGSSAVTLAQVGFNDAANGISMQATAAGAPTVKISGAAFLRNRMAARIAGPATGCNGPAEAVLDIRGDTAAWLNYVMENHEGFWLTGKSALRLDHGVLANNLDQPGAQPNAYLFRVEDASHIAVRNALIYDNDAFPGLTPPYPGGAASGGASVIYSGLSSCASSSFVASTIVNNGADTMFGIGRTSAGLLTLDHVALSGNWGKTFSMSAYWGHHMQVCPPLTILASSSWNDRIIADPAECQPTPLITTWNPAAVPNNPPRTLANYPVLEPPALANHLIKLFEPSSTAPLPAGLYVGRPWSVDGSTDESDNVLDLGYHNPR